jgi:predicted GNAT family N-acyltransferase
MGGAVRPERGRGARTGRLVAVARAVTEADLARAFRIRMAVFVREQGVPKEIELDADDAVAAHFLARWRDRPVGTARVVFEGGQAKIGRMAVLKGYRGRGVGAALLARAVRHARKRGARRIFLHAQLPVVGFYEKFGFRAVGRVFEEAGIPHRKMVWEGEAGAPRARGDRPPARGAERLRR